ncbi:SPOR domain-containing protein [Massilia endophytica]|uniref:SPOR domain-containing protein n=1 Tax=Massilia endophytica TaxID=2899220 RepID=UPI001E5259D7|nr:SPOR domain-containing protein [Massilia endophytica]UGQ45027.1 SPOR domain-containing protein [Massilia endophytica]
MGLFSKLGKNKQESTGEDSGYYRAADDRSLADKAKSKRASHSEGGATRNRGRAARDAAADPVLPEKKRARRRLVGAVALALAVAIGLPMILDSEPKPLANDIAIQIPSKDKPMEAAPQPAPAAPAKVEQAAALDKSEEIIEPPPAKTVTAPPPVAEVKLAPEPAGKPPKTEVKEAPKAPEAKLAKNEHKPETKEAKPEPKRAEAKPEPKESRSDDARALAILEGKPAASTRYVIQIAALSKQDKVEELQGKLREAGIRSTAQKVSTANGELTRVQAGPFASKEEAEKVRAKLTKIGLSGKLGTV